jgi:broad specificity phosphatase PhoE
MNAHQLILIRHGETQWSRTGRHTGRTDVALTEVGQRQADALGSLLAGRSFAAALVSPLQRATETLRHASLDVSRVRVLKELVEWDYGDYEGLTTEEIQRRAPGWTIWTAPVPGGESAADVGRRADLAISRALDEDGDVAIFAHGHLLRALTARWLGLNVSSGRHFALDTATVSILGFERGTPVIHLWNQAGQLQNLDSSAAGTGTVRPGGLRT